MLVVALLTLSTGGLLGTTDEEHFDNSIDYTRRLDAKCHFISSVQVNFNLEGKEPKKQNLEFQYDRYPEEERLQIKEGATLLQVPLSPSYARKKDTAWRESNDEGETGNQASEEQVGEINNMIAIANLPFKLGGNSGAGMKSPGDAIVELVNASPSRTESYSFMKSGAM